MKKFFKRICYKLPFFGYLLKRIDSLEEKIADQNADLVLLYHEFRTVYQELQIQAALTEEYPYSHLCQKVSEIYFQKTGKVLNLKNPQSVNEKIQWLNIFDRTPIKSVLADKYAVRDWVSAKIGSKYLIPLLGVWDFAEQIDFDTLPNKFVLKANHGSSMNLIVKDKNSLDRTATLKLLADWLKKDFSNYSELHYHNIPRKLIAEKYIADSNNELNDYKFFCFNGDVGFIWVDIGRYSDHKRNVYDANFKFLEDISICYPQDKKRIIPKPENFEEMIELVKKLADGFPCVRVDLYNVDGNIYFGEMTFTSGNGVESFSPESFALKMGERIKLPVVQETIKTQA